MQTVLAPGLRDQSDHNPPVVYRIMMPYYRGNISSYSEVVRDIPSAASLTIPDVTPAMPEGIWADNSRKLGVRRHEVLPPQEHFDTNIGPALERALIGFMLDLRGGGMSVVPVLVRRFFPNHRVPRRNGGTGSNDDCWFKLSRDVIVSSSNLRIYFDSGEANGLVRHGVIEPGVEMPPVDFSQSLKDTSSSWICMNY
jgi:hypothetical protein